MSRYNPVFRSFSSNSRYNRKKDSTPCFDMESDFPDTFTVVDKQNDESSLLYTNLTIQEDINECFDSMYKDGWIYGTINPVTNQVVWDSNDKLTVKQDNDQLDGDYTQLNELIERYEKERDEFIENCGYDAYVREYCVSTYPESDDEIEENDNDDNNEDYNDEYSDEDY